MLNDRRAILAISALGLMLFRLGDWRRQVLLMGDGCLGRVAILGEALGSTRLLGLGLGVG
jgi:hypothetical protein